MSRCSMCGGTGQMKSTALDRLDLAEQGHMDLQCLACDGTGQTTLTPPPGLWCNHCQIITINATRCDGCGHEATGQTLAMVVQHSGIEFDPARYLADPRRLCRDCRIKAGWRVEP